MVATTPSIFSSTSAARSEEHTSELQSRSDLVCRLLLEKKKHTQPISHKNDHEDTSTGRVPAAQAVRRPPPPHVPAPGPAKSARQRGRPRPVPVQPHD